MIRVLVNGCMGRMGVQVISAVTSQDGMEVVAGVDPAVNSGDVELGGKVIAPAFTNLKAAIEVTKPDVLVDFTAPSSVEANIRTALPLGIDCVVGTTGLTPQKYLELSELAPEGTTLFHAPNFTIGAVLMMEFSKKAAYYFPDAEVIEFHHNGKKDAPSGTAITTALGIAESRKAAGIKTLAPGKETELPTRSARS